MYELIGGGGKATVDTNMAVSVILQAHGGGLNANQTAKAMADYETLLTTGSVTIEYINGQLDQATIRLRKVTDESTLSGTDGHKSVGGCERDCGADGGSAL